MTRANTPTEKRKVLAVESSTVDTYGAGQIEARHGFSKESNNLPSVKLLTIMEVNSLQPLAFHAQPGNVPDVLSIKNTLKQLDCLMERTPLVVTDCGFTSEEHLLDFVCHSIPTLTRMKLSTSWIREAFDEIKEEITKHANACPFDTFTFGVTKTVKHEFQILRQRTRGQYRMGDVQILPRNLHIHFFYDDEKATADRAAFRSELKQLKGLVENGETLNKAGQQKVERFFFVKETSKGVCVGWFRRGRGRECSDSCLSARASGRRPTLGAEFLRDFDSGRPASCFSTCACPNLAELSSASTPCTRRFPSSSTTTTGHS